MLKKRTSSDFRVAYGFSGRIEEEIEIFQGFREVADREGWQILVLNQQFESQVRFLAGQDSVDGVVGDFMSAAWLKTLPGHLAVVHRGPVSLGPEVFSVGLDERALVTQITAHFLEMGYKDVACYSPYSVAGLPWLRSADAVRRFFRRAEGKGLFCRSDFYAREALALAVKEGVRVPEECGVVGVGNQRLDRLLSDMDISSVPDPLRERGRASARLLLECISGKPPRQIRMAPGPLIPRQSSRKNTDSLSLKSLVEERVLTRLADPPPVSDWARAAGMSRRSFETAFSAECGFTPYAYLLHLRVTEARRLLSTTDWTIARIGEEVGIPDPPRFSAFFKKYSGCAPSEWRATHP